MSYKSNQEKLSVDPSGKVMEAASADSADVAINATSSDSSKAINASSTASFSLGRTGSLSTVTNDDISTGEDPGVGAPYVRSARKITLSSSSITPVSGGNTSLIMGVSSVADVDDTGTVETAYMSSPNKPLYIGARLDYASPTSGLSYFDQANNLVINSTTQNSFLISGIQRAYIAGSPPYAFKLGGTTWANISDSRLKQNVRELGSALDKINELHPVHFEFINSGEDANPSGTRTGFIAQEFEQVLPGHTFEMEPIAEADKKLLGEGVKAKGIEADLVPYLVKAIQELKAELDTVKAELANLKG
jgi:hypothetical protein